MVVLDTCVPTPPPDTTFLLAAVINKYNFKHGETSNERERESERARERESEKARCSGSTCASARESTHVHGRGQRARRQVVAREREVSAVVLGAPPEGLAAAVTFAVTGSGVPWWKKRRGAGCTAMVGGGKSRSRVQATMIETVWATLQRSRVPLNSCARVIWRSFTSTLKSQKR